MMRCVLTLLLAGACVGNGYAERPEDRIGRTVWARPALSERSVDVFADLALRERIPLSAATPLRIERIGYGGPWPHRDPIYRLRLPDGREAYVDVGDFQSRLYHELGPNEVAQSPSFSPPLGQGVQVTQFERSSFFETDPGMIESRVMNQGPGTFVPLRRRGAVPPPGVTTRRIDPVEPVIRPR